MGSEISHKHCHFYQPWRWHWQKPWLCCSSNTQGSSCSQQKLNPLPTLLTLHCDGLTRRGWGVEGLLRLIASNKPPTWRMLVALCQIHKLWLNFSASSSSSFLKPGPFHPIRRFPRGERVLALTHQKWTTKVIQSVESATERIKEIMHVDWSQTWYKKK